MSPVVDTADSTEWCEVSSLLQMWVKIVVVELGRIYYQENVKFFSQYKYTR